MDSQIKGESPFLQLSPKSSSEEKLKRKAFQLDTPFRPFKHQPLIRLNWKSQIVIPEEKQEEEIQFPEEKLEKDLSIEKVINEIISPQKPKVIMADAETQTVILERKKICPQPEMSYQQRYDYCQFLQEKLQKYGQNLKELLGDLIKEDRINQYLNRESVGSQYEAPEVITRDSKKGNLNLEDKQDDTVTWTNKQDEVEAIPEKPPKAKRGKRGKGASKR